MKILNISHGHPSIVRGGAEVASYHLHQEYSKRAGIDSLYLAAMRSGTRVAHAHTPFAGYEQSERELLFLQAAESFDHFLLTPARPTQLLGHFANFLSWSRPDVVHVHHFAGLGVAGLRVAKNALPDTPLLLTLYEFLPICPNDGQFVKTGSFALCDEATPQACHACFPHVSPQEFFLRDRYQRLHYDLVDRFVASSRFIKQRYEEWGIPASKIVVVDNGFPRADPLPPRGLEAGEGRGRFAYFGQLNPFKGILTLLEAFGRIPDEAHPGITLDIFGANLEVGSEAFQRDFQRLVARTPRVRFHGAYENRALRGLMSQVDWVVVPSLWWENSPLVIQEANSFGRPVIASGIGGMAEKVQHRVNGLTFPVGDPIALRDVILEAASSDALWDSLAARLVGGPWIDEVADRLLAEYALLSGS